MRGKRGIVLSLGVLVAGVAVGWFARTPRNGPGESEQGRIDGVRLTSPYIEAAAERDGSPTMVSFRSGVQDFVAELRARDPSLAVSVYLRDLEGHAWTGVGENDGYVPASLMKVAVLFHALSRLESDPALARTTVRYPGPDSMPSPDNLFNAPAASRMVPGESYTFLGLIERMVRHSDNHAKDLLLQGVAQDDIEQLLVRVGVPTVYDEGEAVMSPRAYATLFRLLYRSSVFSRANSELALELLREADFDRGLRAGVPAGVAIASKYGIHFDPRKLNTGQQLHECGIVYAPESPYVICVMTRSLLKSPSQLAEIIAEVSRRAYLALGQTAGPSAAPEYGG